MKQDTSVTTPHELALKRCEDLIDRYNSLRNRHRIAYHTLLVASLVLSGITPLLVMSNLSPIIKALPAALAAIATGVIGIFQWRDSYPRCTYVWESLRSEEEKYLTRTSADYQDKTDKEALNNFVTRVETIAIHEITDWRTLTQSQPQSLPQSQDRPPMQTPSQPVTDGRERPSIENVSGL